MKNEDCNINNYMLKELLIAENDQIYQNRGKQPLRKIHNLSLCCHRYNYVHQYTVPTVHKLLETTFFSIKDGSSANKQVFLRRGKQNQESCFVYWVGNWNIIKLTTAQCEAVGHR